MQVVFRTGSTVLVMKVIVIFVHTDKGKGT